MGAYLSEPITEKISSDDDSDRVRYGASSMQGWRVSQEDAHNCVIDFDKNTSLFAVYDGHGGPEVAIYCSQRLPDFIKQTEAYKNQDLQNALIDAFLGFDATVSTREIIEILKELAGVKDQNDTSQADLGSEDDDENVNNLYEEASMPIEQVMEKYQSNLLCPAFKKLQADKFPISPMLKARKPTGDTPGCSGHCSISSKPDISDECSGSATDTNNEPASSCEVSTSTSTSTSATETTTSQDESLQSILKSEETGSSNNTNTDETQLCKEEVKKLIANGEVNESETEKSTTPQENGDVSPSSKGKGKAIVKKKVKTEAVANVKNLRSRSARPLFTELLDYKDESDSEDENDMTFEGTVSNSSSEEGGDESSEDADDEDEDGEEEEDEDEDESDLYEDNEFTRNMREEPGSDSGCTAVVALLRGNELFVANAGDSRCVVCRGGKAVEMSFDHKPEDEPEMNRVVKAGGKVTQDGRVNGGLNLSRAIGDHAYKQNKELSDREQMITALPDIRTLTINPAEDEFMVLACDGIWNFMSSQDVVDFVRPRLQDAATERLSQICEEMFDHCLAPHTMGDGTGCDNMTAVIVKFKSGVLKRSASSESTSAEQEMKRAKTDDTSTDAVV